MFDLVEETAKNNGCKRLITSYNLKEYKEVIQELRIAKAGIAWTRFEEDTQGGSIYWYDPVETNPGDSLSNRQMSELFGWLSEQFKRD